MADETCKSEPVETTEKARLIYRCKKCRRIVASDENIVCHERGKGESSFAWKKRSGKAEQQPISCTSIFVEPMKWMQAGIFKFQSYPPSIP